MRKCLFLVLFLVSCGLSCGGNKTERVYYPVIDDVFEVANLIETDAGVAYKCPPDSPRFDPVATDGGFLVDECTFAKQNVQDQAELKKVKQQNIVIKTLAKKQQVQVDKAEKAYQDEIFECREKSAPSWWDENGIYVGAAVGLVVGIVISCVAISATTAANSATNSATK